MRKWNTDDDNLVTDEALKNNPPISILIKQIKLDIQREYKAQQLQQLDEARDAAALQPDFAPDQPDQGLNPDV
jgi:hypothetical protein